MSCPTVYFKIKIIPVYLFLRFSYTHLELFSNSHIYLEQLMNSEQCAIYFCVLRLRAGVLLPEFWFLPPPLCPGKFLLWKLPVAICNASYRQHGHIF